MALPKRPRSSTVLCTSSIGWDVPGLFGLIRQCSYICSWIWKRKFGSGNMANVFFIYKKDPCYLYTKTYLVPLPTGPLLAPHRCPDSGCVHIDGSLDAFAWHPGGDCQWMAGAVISQHGQGVENSWGIMGRVFPCGKPFRFCNVLTRVDQPYNPMQPYEKA